MKRIGVAVGETTTGSARPLLTLDAVDGKPDWDAVARILEEWQPQALVIGLPSHADGRAHVLAPAAQRFGRQLHGRFRLPVHEVDEHLTSVAAEHLLAQRRVRRSPTKGHLDQVAASVILQAWLDTRETP